MTLAPGQIDLWLVRDDQVADDMLLSQMRALLSPAERAQEPRFHFPHDRKRYLLTRALVRTVLSRYAPVAPADWQFAANAHGRPRIALEGAGGCGAGCEGLDFNLSHARGLIALAVARHRTLGVDVEQVSARRGSLDIAQRFFSPREAADLAGVPALALQERFYEYWTFKESYIKARGRGLSLPLEQFGFTFPSHGEVHLSVDSALDDDAARWSFWQMQPTPEHLLALCAERTPAQATVLTVREAVPLQGERVVHLPVLRRSEPGTASALP